jgi:hypothetical protein
MLPNFPYLGGDKSKGFDGGTLVFTKFNLKLGQSMTEFTFFGKPGRWGLGKAKN